MGTFNRTVSILILVLAIVAVIFGSMLFKKREQLRRRGDKMAESINEVAKTLDSESDTNFAESLDPDIKIVDPTKTDKGYVAGNENKSLYHTNYANLPNLLKKFETQADNIKAQRDTLGLTLQNIAETLELPEQENYAAGEFHKIETYNPKKTALLELVSKVNNRDNALVQQFIDSASAIGGFTLNADALKDLDNYSTPLGEFDSKVKALKQRSDTYARHIRSICSILDVSSPSLDGDDYSSALRSAEDGVRAVKEEFEQMKKDLRLTREQLAATTERLTQAEAKIGKLEDEKLALKARLREFTDPRSREEISGKQELVKRLEGEVLEVNDKWDFVVINLGSDNKMVVGSKDKPHEITVPLPKDEVMHVARKGEYIAKIKVIQVNDNCAIADVVPDLKNKKINAGDRVFFQNKDS